MSQVKAYEQLTMQAAVERSYQKALQALTIHPLVEDASLAKKILNGYLKEHGSYFPKLI
jgi:alpha-galactosidase/6-phospho-beta-glucosidase family protein